jgi:acetyl esterase/lipase
MHVSRKKRFILGALVVFGAVCLCVWPARRNYYGKLGSIEVRRDLPYIAGSRNPKQQLDLFLPHATTKPFPIVVFVHGGYWSPLDRRWLQPLLGTHGNVGAAFARRGIGAAVIGYRQFPEAQKGDDSLDDIAHAIGFVERMAAAWGGDPARVFVMGHSAGGHLVALLAMEPTILERNDVKSVPVGFIAVDGVFDLGAALTTFKPEQRSVMRTLFGPDDADLAAHSPITYASATNPRAMLFIDSTSDEPVCRDAFHQMRGRLSQVGNKAQFVELEGLGHNEMIVRVGTDDDKLTATVAEYVENH